LGGFGDRAPRPPAADRSDDSPDERSKRAGGSSNARSQYRAGNAAGGLANLVGRGRRWPVRSQRRVLRPFDPSVRRSRFPFVIHIASCPPSKRQERDRARLARFRKNDSLGTCPAASVSERKVGTMTRGSARFILRERVRESSFGSTAARSIPSKSTRRS